MINVDIQDSVTLKISHVMPKSKKHDMDLYLFIPGELELSPELMSESEFYYSSIHQKQVYYSDQTLLPLVHSRLAQRGHLSSTQYRVSLSLFAYQYVVALDKAVNQLNKPSDNLIADEVDSVIELSLDILKRLRRTIPYDEQLKRYYANIDNYLSWYTEQKFLSLVAHITRDNEYKTIKARLITLVEKEEAHRKLNDYNSEQVNQDITRMSNKMRLLRRLIEHPIVLNEKVTSLGNNIKRAVKGTVTGFVMIFVTLIAISARDYWGEITMSFIIAMSFVYALREIFKDDLRDMLWRWLRKGKPRWKRRYKDPTTGKLVGHKIEWLDYTNLDKLPTRIKTIRKRRVVQREEQILYYRSQTEMATSLFMSGYEETKETLYIDLRQITRLIDKSSSRIYQLNNGQVSRESVEKRQLLNLIIKENNHKDEPSYSRWKIVLNRNKIVAVEAISLDS